MQLEERRDWLYQAETDLEFRAGFLKILDDPDLGDVFFINVCCWTYDPRIGDNYEPIGDVPFLLWEAQENAVRKIGRAMDRGHHLGVEKSRDQGVTWMALACILRRFLRKQGFSALIGAMTEGLLDDKKNTDSLGWKIDKMFDNLPAFLRPRGFDERLHRSWCNWVNPENGSSIAGKAPTARFAVGGRRSVIYFDDFAQWDVGATAWQLAAASTSCRLASWTVNPDNPMNHAYEIAYSVGKFKGTKTPIVPVAELHWSDDPRKQAMARDPQTGELYNVWKRQKLEDISEEQFSRDYEGVYELAPKGRIYSAQLPYVRIGSFPYDPRLPLFTAWDFGISDTLVIGFFQRDWEAHRWRFVEVITRSGQDTAYYIPFLTGKKDAHEILEYESEYDDEDHAAIQRRTDWQRPVREKGQIVRKVVYEAHYGDPAGSARGGSSNKSPRRVLANAGIDITVRNDNAGKGYKGRIEAARYLLKYIDINEERCGPLITALQNYQWNDADTQPVHDEHSHACAMVEYASVNVWEEFKEDMKRYREARAMGQAERPGGIFGWGGDYLKEALNDEKADRDVVVKATTGYNGGSGRSITGY